MKKLILLFCIIISGCFTPVIGQSSADEDALTKLLAKLFRGMQLGDSAMVSSTFTKGATMATVSKGKNNEAVLRQNPNALRGFLQAVGTPHTDTWFEEAWNIKVQIDGDFAQVWCDYAFYRGKENFSHCGADAFHAYKGIDGWRFFHLAYSIRTTDCTIPEEVKQKHQ